MAVKSIEPGGDADFGVGLWSGPQGGTTTVATDFVHGGHIKSLSYGKSVENDIGIKGVVQDAGARISWYVYLNALPGTTSRIAQVVATGYGSSKIIVQLTSGGVLQLWNSGALAQIGSNGATLSTGQWYRLCLSYTVTSSSVNSINLYVNGTSSISVTNGSGVATGTADVLFGNISGNASLDMRTSDHYIDNSSALTDTGNIWVTAKRPNANGTANQFTTQIGSGGSGYGTGHSPQVNERPESDTNGWSLNLTTKQTEEYNIESAATGDINISSATIIDYMGWIRAKESTTSNTPVAHIIVNNVATTKTLTTTAAYYTQVAGSATYPAGTGTDIGMDGQYTSVAGTYSLYECGIVVAYIPAAVTNTYAPGLMMMGMGC